jgi:hypothetical protein
MPAFVQARQVSLLILCRRLFPGRAYTTPARHRRPLSNRPLRSRRLNHQRPEVTRYAVWGPALQREPF